MQISLRLMGADKFQLGANRFAKRMPGVTAAAMEKAMRRAMQRSVPWLGGSAYRIPPTPSYRRTGTLGQATWVEASASERGSYARVISDAVSPHGVRYSRLVIGDAAGQGQAAVHAGRWVPLRTAVDDETRPLLAEIDGDLGDVARQEGIGL